MLLLSIGLPSLHVQAADDLDFQDYEDAVTDYELNKSLSKDYVFQGESFGAEATVSATLLEDLSFNNVVDIEYDVIAQPQSGGSIMLGSFTTSVGPMLNLKSGTRWSTTLMDVPVAFPATAIAGDYTISMEITGFAEGQEAIWNTVKGNIDEEFIVELGSIKYLGMERPEISFDLTSPDEVDAGASFDVDIDVTLPTGVEQVDFSLSYQKASGSPVLVENLSVSATGTTSLTQSVTAPLYNGELKLIASVNKYVVMGTEITPTVQVPATTITIVNLTHPTVSLIVSNPVTEDVDVDFTLKVTNPNSSAVSMGVYILPEWDIPEWAGEEMSWFFADMVTVEVAANDDEEVSVTVNPITEGGAYELKAMYTQYELDGQTVKASPAIMAEAMVTTAADLVGQITLSRASVYPYEGYDIDAIVYNPGGSGITVDYEINVYVSDSSEDLFNTTPTDDGQSGSLDISAGANADISYSSPAADQAKKYMGFELVVDGESLAKATLYVKAAAPPSIKVVPSTYVASAGQSIDLDIELQNQMGVATTFTLQILQRVWNGTDWTETLIDEENVSLSANGKKTVTASTTTPAEPVIIEYGARVSQMTISSTNFSAPKSSWVRVELKQVVLPEVTLSLNPNPAQVGSSMEIRVTVTNPSDNEMIVPLSIYLKPPSSFRFLYEQRDVTVAAGESDTFSEYLEVEESWQSFGSMGVIVTADQLTYGGVPVPLATPIEVKKSCTIMDLQLKAALKTEVTEYSLSYDSANNYLVMDSVELLATIVVSNLGGWGSCPELTLTLQVPTSDGVTLVEGWQQISKTTSELIGGDLSTTARITIANPTAANLANVEFVARVTAGSTVEEFNLGLFRIADGSWRLNDNAWLVSRASGSRFASAAWDSDGDGFSDYTEMVEGTVTNPLNASDPAEAISTAEKEQRVQELEAMINSYVFRAEQFIDTVSDGGALLPSGQEAWERMVDQGQSAQDSLELLKDLTEDEYSDLTTEVNDLVEDVNNLETPIAEKYGDSSTPKEIRDIAIETILGMSSEESNADPDGDGLPTAVELGLGYDPNKWDSQQPGTSDKDYLASTVSDEDVDDEDQDLLGSYIAVGQMGRILDDMRENLPEDWAMTEADEQALLEQAQQDLRDATWEYINAFFI